MVRPREDRQPELERVVEERRRGLAHTAADRRQDERADDLLPFEEAALGRALADDVVEREVSPGSITVPSMKSAIRCTLWIRFDDDTPISRRERDELAADPERVCVGRRQLGVARAELDLRCAVAVGSGGHGRGEPRRVDVATGSRRNDVHACRRRRRTARCARGSSEPTRGRTSRASDSGSNATAKRCLRGLMRSECASWSASATRAAHRGTRSRPVGRAGRARSRRRCAQRDRGSRAAPP